MPNIKDLIVLETTYSLIKRNAASGFGKYQSPINKVLHMHHQKLLQGNKENKKKREALIPIILEEIQLIMDI